jgi:hypothetical protein
MQIGLHVISSLPALPPLFSARSRSRKIYAISTHAIDSLPLIDSETQSAVRVANKYYAMSQSRATAEADRRTPGREHDSARRLPR